MTKIDDKQAYRIHISAYSDSDSDIDGKADFDKIYHLLKPPPLELDEDSIIEITSDEKQVENVWEARLRRAQDSEKITKTLDENTVLTQPKKKRKKKSKSKTVSINVDQNNIKLLEQLEVNLLSASVKVNSATPSQSKIDIGTNLDTLGNRTPNNLQGEQNQAKKKQPVEASTNKNMSNVQSVTKMPDTMPLTTYADNHTHSNFLTQLEYAFGADFKEFLESVLQSGTSVSELNNFTYEQLRNAYNAHRQKKIGYDINRHDVPAQQRYSLSFHPGNTFNNVTGHPNYHFPANFNTNTAFHQSNTTWYQMGNASTNTMLYFLPTLNVPNPNGLTGSVSTNTARFMEIKDSEAKPKTVAPKMTKAEKKKQEAAKNNGAFKSSQSESKPKNIKQTKQMTNIPLDGSTAIGTSQCSMKEESEVKSFICSKDFDKALKNFIQTLEMGKKLITEAKQAEKYLIVHDFLKFKDDINDLLDIIDYFNSIIERCLETCTLIGNKTITKDPMVTFKKNSFLQYGTLLKDLIDLVSIIENKFLLIYKKMYNNLIRYVITTHAAVVQCSQAYDAFIEELRKNRWIDTNKGTKASKHATRLKNPKQAIKSSKEFNEADSSSFGSSSEEPPKTDRVKDSESLLLSLASPNDDLKSRKETHGEIPPLETKETVCEVRRSTDDDTSRENWTWYDTFKDTLMFHSVGLHSNVWWCHLIFIILITYLLIAAVDGVTSFLLDHIIHIFVTMFLYNFFEITR